MANNDSWARDLLKPLFRAEQDVARAYESSVVAGRKADSESISIAELCAIFLPLSLAHSTAGKDIDPANAVELKRRLRAAVERAANGKLGPDSLIPAIAESFAVIAPGWRAPEWESVLQQLISDTFGGSYLRIRRDPAADVRAAAAHCTAAQLMDKFSISRSYAYRLVKEARSKKVHKTD